MAPGIPCMLMRGGSSKGAYFERRHLPVEPALRDELLCRLLGSPDPRQIDGIGGGHPLTSKVAIVAPSDEDGVDLDYLFLQVGVESDLVTDRQNCGNLLAGVGPFALERGLFTGPDNGFATVRVRMRNSDSVAMASFEVAEGAPLYEGPTAISGVPGTAAPIDLAFEDIAGSATGQLLPTERTSDTVAGVACTLIDNGMPVVVLRADAVGATGHEATAELENDRELRDRLETIRLEAGWLMGLGDVASSTIPKMTLVAPPRQGGHLCTRTFIPHRCHEAIGVLGAVSVATAALLAGSPAHSCLDGSPEGVVRLEHPTGFFDAVVDVAWGNGGAVTVPRAGIVRTARKLMDGLVFPRDLPTDVARSIV